MKTVTCILQGGLGNQLCQKSTTIAYSIKHNIQYAIPKQTLIETFWKSYRLGNVVYKNVQPFYTYKEPAHSFVEIPVIKSDCIALSGFFQSYKYFQFCLPELIKIFDFKYEPVDCTAIHVRRGDYLKKPDKFPVVTEAYLTDAITYITNRNKYERFRFFSNDIDWCKNFVSRLYNNDERFSFSEGKTDVEDLQEMSGCAHQIISNSTYGIWGALLNQNPDKVVICPHESNYFGKAKKHLDTKDIYPAEWIRIKF